MTEYKEKLHEALAKIEHEPICMRTVEQATAVVELLCAIEKLDGEKTAHHTFTEADAKAWTARMVNEDGTTGAHWTKEQAEQVAKVAGVDVPSCVWWAVLNMVYSDYCKVAAKYNLDRPEFYSDLARAFLMDKDAESPEEKTAAYFHYVAE